MHPSMREKEVAQYFQYMLVVVSTCNTMARTPDAYVCASCAAPCLISSQLIPSPTSGISGCYLYIRPQIRGAMRTSTQDPVRSLILDKRMHWLHRWQEASLVEFGIYVLLWCVSVRDVPELRRNGFLIP